jgi:hypothetical protein
MASGVFFPRGPGTRRGRSSRGGRNEDSLGVLAMRVSGDVARDRLPGVVLATSVVCVQLTWGAALVYLGFHFL